MADGLAQMQEAYELARYESEASLERTWTLICLAGGYSQHLVPEEAERRLSSLRGMIGDSITRDRSDSETPNELRVATVAALDAMVQTRSGHVLEALSAVG